jgi:hypothetical protein
MAAIAVSLNSGFGNYVKARGKRRIRLEIVHKTQERGFVGCPSAGLLSEPSVG